MASNKRTETKQGGVSDGYIALFPLRIAKAFSSDPINPQCTGYNILDSNGIAITSPLPEAVCNDMMQALYIHQYEMQSECDGQRQELLCKLTILLDPPSKKNGMQIIKSKQGRFIIIPNAKYNKTLSDVKKMGKTIFDYSLPGITYPIEDCMRLVVHYYRAMHHRIDGTNLESAICDILVSNGTIKDDDIRHLHDTDGRRVWYDNERPRIEAWIFKFAPNGMKKAP